VDRDLRHFIPADVPLGTRDLPYDDRDENWHIVIFEEDGWVYVAENDVQFRVPREHYIREWAALIDAFNPIAPLDETEN
jgi:hypothetical protein